MSSPALTLGALPLIVVAIDQLAKALVLRWTSDTAAQGHTLAMRLGLSQRLMACLLAVLGAATLLLATTSAVEVSALGGVSVALGGAASNLLDHLHRGAVVDHLRFARWTFNLADVAVVLGAVWAVSSALMRAGA
ncbi:MAG: signal peptidase II [Chloroflexota bacterium]